MRHSKLAMLTGVLLLSLGTLQEVRADTNPSLAQDEQTDDDVETKREEMVSPAASSSF